METATPGALIHWEESGSGSPLILLHGNGEDLESLRRQINAFSPHFRVIAVDSRGHGASTAGGDRLSLYDMAEDVVCVMKDAGIDRADVLGFSDGGNIAMILAIRHPERVRRLVLSGANCDPGGIRLRYAVPMWLEDGLRTVCTPFSAKACRKKELLDLMVKEPKITREQLRSIRAETLLTAGEKDIISRSHTEYLHRNIPGSELLWFPGGHFTPFERAEDYNAAVLAFLTEEN